MSLHNYLFIVTAGFLSITQSAAQSQYEAYDLGPGVAYSINAVGTVVGQSGSFSVHHAFSYSGGIMTDLGTLGGANSSAQAVNRSGAIVGTSDSPAGYWHGFLYSQGSLMDLGVYSSAYSYAHGINDSGTIVGSVWTTGNKDHAAYYSNGHWTDMGTLGGNYSGAVAINSSGTIVGRSDLSFGTHAFRYSNGVMTDLGTFGGAVSYAMDINDSGVIVGYGSTPDDSYYRAFRYADGVMSCIGTLGSGAYSYANAVNGSGVIVGNSDINNKGDKHAFRYSDGQMVDLAPELAALGLTGNSEALDINDLGEIVGVAYDAQGTPHAFLLAVPEPSSLALLALAGVCWVLRKPHG